MSIVPQPDRRRTAGSPRTVLAVFALFALATIAVALLARYDVFGSSSSSSSRPSSGGAAAQARTVPPFSAVELAGSNDVTITVGGKQSVVVHADRKLLRRVTTEVRAGALVIGNTPGPLASTSPMRVVITTPTLSALRLTGSGVISAQGIRTRTLTVTLSGSGVVQARGAASILAVRLDGSGNAALGALTARDASVQLGGVGTIVVTATRSLHASVSGTGSILYSGQPADVTSSVTGNGTVLPVEGAV
jgi:hypothetical protein